MRSQPRADAALRRSDPDMVDVVAARDDRAAFATLYRRYVDRVYGYAFYQLGDHHDAEDATERTFMAALRGLPEFEDRGSTFRAWLFRIAHNTVANAHRSRSRRRAEPLPESFERPAPNADPAGLVAVADELHEVRRAIAEMPDDRRQVILLRFVDGLSTAEVAEVLDRSPGAVRVLLHRSLRDLTQRLGRSAGGGAQRDL
ncbi:MAG TPA: RNA polymerase sigma factor [Candidatus Limnocylindria bacterium]|nr:RNA polymerase sigma factor [Candidatus Limnocylindria bacterium]